MKSYCKYIKHFLLRYLNINHFIEDKKYLYILMPNIFYLYFKKVKLSLKKLLDKNKIYIK